ncbi:MAG: PQQ-like beta-propeller repeat protein [Phycisphaerales bacterium]|nr:MAG: PQQ-like beta-propeller repeat protein [Phycisphaerales bacterium]
MLSLSNLWKLAPAGAAWLMLSAIAAADDWNNSGKNPGRNALSAEIGPESAEILWSGGRTSLIAWQPVIEGERVFMVRQSGWPSDEPGASPVVAMDLNTGEELWAEHIPFSDGDWTTWIAGVRDGKVYAGRSGNGASVSAKLYALDAADGHTLWISEDEIDAGAYDGVVFAPNGDLIIGSFMDIWRISAADGSTVWHSPRTGSVSGTCGAALHGDAVYVADAVYGGTEIVRYDLATGAEMYASDVMPGFTIQNTPMCGPDGTIYLSRTQKNPDVDYFYALEDDGTQITEKWHVPAAWTTTSEFGIGPDGSVYMMAPGYELVRLDPEDGTQLNTTGPLDGFSKPHMAIDADGKIFLSNGAFNTGRLYSYDADLTWRWDVPVTNINIGGPALGSHGTLVVCGVSTDVRAYRTEIPCPADVNDDNIVDIDDLFQVLGMWGTCDDCPEDINDDGLVDIDDIFAVLAEWGPCPGKRGRD